MKYVLLDIGGQCQRVLDLPGIMGQALVGLPTVLRLLCENHIRNGGAVGPMLDAMRSPGKDGFEFSFLPNRLLMHDTTCTPALADIAAMRDAVAAPSKPMSGMNTPAMRSVMLGRTRLIRSSSLAEVHKNHAVQSAAWRG